jgi:hypothetical protein
MYTISDQSIVYKEKNIIPLRANDLFLHKVLVICYHLPLAKCNSSYYTWKKRQRKEVKLRFGTSTS